MNTAIRRVACAVLQAAVLTAAASSSLGLSKPFEDSSNAMPMDEAQWVVETDTRKVVAPAQPEPSEIGPVAQAFGTTSEPARNVTPGRSGNENTTVSALKALAEQVKSLESKIAAQDARIALLERSLDDLQRRINR